MKIKLLLLITLTFFINTYAQIDFEEHILTDESFSTEYPISIYSIDIDGDGDLDALSAFEFLNKIVWYENLDGQGSFGQQKTISNNDTNRIKAIYFGDADGDGDIDVFSASWDDNKIAWYENEDGLGNFGPQQNIGYSGSANSVYVSDIDGDGDLDVLSAGPAGGISWFENLNGQGDFGQEHTVGNNGGRYIKSSDIDGDGDMDIIESSSSIIRWYENLDGLGNFSIYQSISLNENDITSININDLDNDGDMDVMMTSDEDNKVAWYENLDGQGNFGSQLIISENAYSAKSAIAADIDNDGDLDVLSAYEYNTIHGNVVWFENLDGQGNFGSQQIIYTEGPNFAHPGDINGDGNLDVILSSSYATLGWLENTNGQGNFGEFQRIDTNGVGYTNSADIDGDGDMDLISAYGRTVWWENLDGQGNFSLRKIISEQGSTSYPIDIDGDGDIDVVSSNSNTDGDIFWYENLDGLGDFGSLNVVIGEVSRVNDIFAADLDNDGDIDLLSASSNDNKIAWYENIDGLGSFDVQHIISTIAYGANSVISADVDGDGDLDVFSASWYGNNIAWYENLDGQGNFGSQQIIDADVDGSNIKLIHSTDLDGDGDLDVIFSADAAVLWYENIDGLGNFSSQQVITENVEGSGSVSSIDLDNDGDMDVFSASSIDNKIAWYENIGGQADFFIQHIISENAIGARSVIVSDLNNDNKIDVISISSGVKLAWYENIGVLYNQIYGNLNFDIDLNNCNSNFFPLNNVLVKTDNGVDSFATFTNPDGNYVLYPNEGDFTTIITSELPNYFISNPAFYTSNFVGVGNVDIADFCLEPIDDVNDLNISLYPLNIARPGFNVTYQIVYRNVGTTIITDALELTFDETKISYIEASQAPVIQSSNSLTFDYYDLLPFETRTVNVTFNVFTPPTTEIGDILAFTAVISPVTGDYTEEDNTSNFDHTVIGAYDPNDIQVLEGDEIVESDTDNYLHYIIRFQNVGTASAINVRVTNELDPNLDWNTLQIENISHANRVEIRDGNQVEFIFDNINLPDSTSNEPESHGYIQYKIKPKSTIGLGDSMSNTADIFFDFNPAVVTNTVITTVVENLSVGDNVKFKASIYPNPTTGVLNISSNTSVVNVVTYNQLGQIVVEKSNNEGIQSITLNELSRGIYFIKLSDANFNYQIQKLIKE